MIPGEKRIKKFHYVCCLFFVYTVVCDQALGCEAWSVLFLKSIAMREGYKFNWHDEK